MQILSCPQDTDPELLDDHVCDSDEDKDGHGDIDAFTFDIGTKIAKKFNGVVHNGEVVAMRGSLRHIVYEDGDKEDFNEQECMEGVRLFNACAQNREN